jgi:hypothetical protein
VLRWLVSHENFPVRHVDRNAHVKTIKAFVLLMTRFNHDLATGDAGMVTIQLRGFLMNGRGDCREKFRVPKVDSKVGRRRVTRGQI